MPAMAQTWPWGFIMGTAPIRPMNGEPSTSSERVMRKASLPISPMGGRGAYGFPNLN